MLPQNRADIESAPTVTKQKALPKQSLLYNQMCAKITGAFNVYSARQIGIYLSVSINTALHGEPSAPAKFSGAAFKK